MAEKNREQKMVDALPIGAAVFTGPDHTVLAINGPMLEIWNKDSSVIGKNLHDAIPELVGQPFHDLLTNIYRTGKPYHDPNGKARLLVDGSMQEVHFDFSFKPLKDHTGQIVGIVNTALNTNAQVAAQKKVQELNEALSATNEEQIAVNEELQSVNDQLITTIESLQTSNERVSLAQQAAQLGMFDWDFKQGKQIQWDQRCAELFWRPYAGEVDYQRDFVDKLHPDDRERVIKALNDSFDLAVSDGRYDVEYRTINKESGQSRWVRAIGKVLFDGQGNKQRFIGTVMDITSDVLMREKLKFREEQLKLAIQSANLGTWYMSVDNDEFIPSLRLKELFGYFPDDDMPYAAALTQITDNNYREMVVQAVEDAIREGEAYDLEYPIIGYRDKVLRWVKATGKLYPASESSPSHFSGTVADITERKMKEQRQSDFIGVVSHELKSPLTSISGYIQVLSVRAKKISDSTISDIVLKAKRQIDRMQAIISGFLDVARMEEGNIKLNKQRFNMADLVKRAEEESLVTITSHKLVFHPVKYTPVEADQDKIEQVLINFINNAVKYSPLGSIINVACYAKNNIAHISVQDEGLGIAPKDQERIFDRFYRVESMDVEKVKGFGIGLYISKEIIEMHGGKIGVNSEIGKGSTFWFDLTVLNS